jgi:hypothetical protein
MPLFDGLKVRCIFALSGFVKGFCGGVQVREMDKRIKSNTIAKFFVKTMCAFFFVETKLGCSVDYGNKQKEII